MPKKKSAGESVQTPLHGDLFFCDQTVVDEYVESVSKPGIWPIYTNSIIFGPVYIIIYGCSDFLAGSSIRLASRYRALNETAVFGCVCRHEYPIIMFFNLKHGER